MATLFVLQASMPAAAQAPFDKRTIVTVSGPVHIPGTSLGAGKYVFKLHDSLANRHIVQVWSGDESKLLATILAVPAQRPEVSEETVITFDERESTSPPAIRYWYYPSQRIGHEFVYPRDEAMRIARASNQPVQSTTSPTGTPQEMAKADVTVVNPDAAAQTTAAQPRAESTQARASQPSSPAMPSPSAPEPARPAQTDRAADSGALPSTASMLPLAAAIGLLSLSGALVTRAIRRRSN
jgi:hypothetical protein